MTDAYHYMRYVIQNHRRGMIAYATGENLFDRRDKAENWNMRKAAFSGADTFWEVGWLHRANRRGMQESYFYSPDIPPAKYWWCRDAHWSPYWGKETENRAKLMKEMRAYWVNKWFGETVPEIKETLLKTTPLPEDVVNLLPEYFEYPHQTKMVV